MGTRVIALVLLAIMPAMAGKVTWTTAAAMTTIGINLLDAPASYRKFRTAIRKTGHVVKKAGKKVVGK